MVFVFTYLSLLPNTNSIVAIHGWNFDVQEEFEMRKGGFGRSLIDIYFKIGQIVFTIFFNENF